MDLRNAEQFQIKMFSMDLNKISFFNESKKNIFSMNPNKNIFSMNQQKKFLFKQSKYQRFFLMNANKKST